MEQENKQTELQESKPEVKSQDPQRKRSKRHRRNRNNISDKARVESVKEFGIYAREVDRAYKARYPKQQAITVYAK